MINRYPPLPARRSSLLPVLTIALLLSLLARTTAAPPTDTPAPISDGAWTIVVIPDTQYYSRSDENAPIFKEMTEWMVAHKQSRNIQLVLHVGDIVQDNKDREWTHAKEALQVLDGEIPYILAVGNHDLGRNARSRDTMLNQYFKLGDNPLNQAMFGGYFREGDLENAWYRFRYRNWDTVIFSLEFGPRNEVVAWANEVATQHPEQSLMLVTHEFIDQESSLFSDDGLPRRTTPKTKNNPHQYGIAKNGGTVHCGEELWQAFVSQHPNFKMVVNGHYKPFELVGTKEEGKVRHVHDLTSVHRSDPHPHANGEIAHQMLFNAQWAPRGGHGWLRLLEIQPDGKTVQVKTFSPHLARTAEDPATAWRRTPNCEFTFEWPALSQ